MARLLRPALLVPCLVLTVVLAGCGGTAAPQTAIDFEQLSRAAKTSADTTSGRFAFSVEMSYPGADEPFELAGEGAFDAASERASLSFDFSSFAKLLGGFFQGFGSSDLPDFDSEDWTIETVQDGDIVYMRMRAFADQLPDGKSWVRADGAAGAAQGFDFAQLEEFASNDPRKMLDLLRAASGEIETVGTETLRGVDTTHYRATLDLDGYEPQAERSQFGELVEKSGVAEVPVDVWLDEFGLVRKVAMSVTATEPDPGQAELSFELWDYGKDVAIEVPPADQVVAASALG